jgi:hypothetical protein
MGDGGATGDELDRIFCGLSGPSLLNYRVLQAVL